MKKNNPSFSITSNAIYFFKLQWLYSKLSVLFLLLLVSINVLISFINIYLPKLVVGEIISKKSFEQIIISVIPDQHGVACINHYFAGWLCVCGINTQGTEQRFVHR